MARLVKANFAPPPERYWLWQDAVSATGIRLRIPSVAPRFVASLLRQVGTGTASTPCGSRRNGVLTGSRGHPYFETWPVSARAYGRGSGAFVLRTIEANQTGLRGAGLTVASAQPLSGA